MRTRWTDHDEAPRRRPHVLVRVLQENDGDRRDAQVGKLVGVRERVRAQIDREAVLVGFLYRLAIREVMNHVIVRECKSASAAICVREQSQATAIDRDLIVAEQIASNVMAPDGTGRQGADDVKQLIESI